MHRFGLIGHPIEHSLSPKLFTAAYDGRYPYDLIQGADFELSWQRFMDSYHAINVTAPFKGNAYEKADIRTEECLLVGATNLVVKTPEGTVAYNSDYRGVMKVLSDNGFTKGMKALVVGYGGAGKAAAAAARSLGLDTQVCNRSAKAEGIRPLSDIPALAKAADIVIYTLPMLVDEAAGMEAGCILEANYKDPVLDGTSGRYIHGKQWLLAQAVTGYELMTGEIPNNLSILYDF